MSTSIVLSRSLVRRAISLGLVCSAGLAMSMASPVSAAIVDDFEGVSIGASPNGWPKVLGRVDLGTAVLGGCTSVDTSDYSSLRDYVSQAGIRSPLDTGSLGSDHPILGSSYKAFVARGDASQYVFGTDPVWSSGSYPYFLKGPATATQVGTNAGDLVAWNDWTSSEKDNFKVLQASWLGDSLTDAAVGTYTVKVVDGTGYGRSGNVLELFSEMSRSVYGYVQHGPVIVTPVLTVGAGGATFTFDWAAQGGGDDYHVLGYLVDTSTCTQTELLDSTGYNSSWQTVSVSVAAGTYRFVFVSGTYDQSWGGYAGARLFVDNMNCDGDCIVEDVGSPTAGIHSSDWDVDFEALKEKVAASNAYPGEPLMEGICSELVRRIQGVVGATQDGCFGPITAQRVKNWQSSHGLRPDGIVGQATWNAMFS